MFAPFLTICLLISLILAWEKKRKQQGQEVPLIKKKSKRNRKSRRIKKDDEKEKETEMMTTIFKVQLRGSNCILNIQDLLLKCEGVKNVSMDLEHDLVKVYSTKDVKALVEPLTRALSRPVEILHKETKLNNNNKMFEKGPTAFKVDCQSCIDKIKKLPELHLTFAGEMEFSRDMVDDLVVRNGDIGRLRMMLKKPVEISQRFLCWDHKNKSVSTGYVFKLRVYCNSCMDSIRRIILRFQGVRRVDVMDEEDMLMVYGTMNIQELSKYLERILKRREKKLIESEEENDHHHHQVSATVFKVRLHCSDCITKMEKLVLKYPGVTEFSVDQSNDLVTVIGSVDNIALTNYMRTKFKRSVHVVQSNKQVENEQSKDDGDGGDDDDDDNNDNSGGDNKSKRKDCGGDGNGDDIDKSGGGRIVQKGFEFDYLGEGRLGYKYGYHAGFEDEYPVGQSRDKGKFSASSSSGLIEDMKNIVRDLLWLGDVYGQLILPAAQVFDRGKVNACSVMRSLVLV